jgi:hypothetical protein
MPSPIPADARLRRRQQRFIGQASPSAHAAFSPHQICRCAVTKRIREPNRFGIHTNAQTAADPANALNYRQAYLQIIRNSKWRKVAVDGLASFCDTAATMVVPGAGKKGDPLGDDQAGLETTRGG